MSQLRISGRSDEDADGSGAISIARAQQERRVCVCVGSRSVSPDMNVASGGAWPRGLIIDDVNRWRDRPGILHLAIEISCRHPLLLFVSFVHGTLR